MIVFLEKVREKTLFSALDPIITEPLELIYIQTVLSQEGIESYIIDPLFKMNKPGGIVPDLIILSGYNVAEKLIIKRANDYKGKYPFAKIMVSGVHAQINRQAFRVSGIDFVYFSQGFETFKSFLGGAELTKGMDIYNKDTDTWIIGEDDLLKNSEDIVPCRGFFNLIKEKTRYIDKKSVALVKGAHGCPYKCNFCYCRLLNKGKYIKPDYDKLMSQVYNIDSEYIWLIDDCFLTTREDAISFIKASKKYSDPGTGGKAPIKCGSQKSLIAYLRADFIVENEGLLFELKACGLDEVIVGFESPDADKLEDYNKGQSSSIYKKLAAILKRENIELTALFIVDPQYHTRDFIRLFKYIKDLDISVYTLSIMTPLKGTLEYENKKHLLTTTDPAKFDFLHLVIPSKLPKWYFYSLFYIGHLRLLKSKRIRKMIRGLL